MKGHCDGRTLLVVLLVFLVALLPLQIYREDVFTFPPSAGGISADSSSGSISAAAKAILEPPKTSSPAVQVHSPRLPQAEEELRRARAVIRRALASKDRPGSLASVEYVPVGGIYRNARAFHWSYKEMEKRFQIFVYEEGEPPLVHNGPCKDIYTTEGRFIHELELGNRFITKDPTQAHAYFLPFSVVMMVSYLYKPMSSEITAIKNFAADYIDVVARKHPFWNRSHGADHFMLSCHDWGPRTSRANNDLYTRSIRVLCNANSSEGFDPQKDVSLPEMNLKTGLLKDLIGGVSALRRTTLAFFAGGNHGPIRSLLLKEWKDKNDPDMQVHEYLPKGENYHQHMKRSKFCLCPSGYEVGSPRIVEAIYSECVPVTISEHYVLPFSDVLNWNAFSVQVSINDIPQLKNILQAIPEKKYVAMQKRVKQVQRHFMITQPVQPYDMFHMILHSVWLRRLNFEIEG